MRNRLHLYLCAALLAMTSAAAAQSGRDCAARDPNPSSINAGCSAGLPAVSAPLGNSGSAIGEGSLDRGATSSLPDVNGTPSVPEINGTTTQTQPNMPSLDVPENPLGTGPTPVIGGTRGDNAISGDRR